VVDERAAADQLRIAAARGVRVTARSARELLAAALPTAPGRAAASAAVVPPQRGLPESPAGLAPQRAGTQRRPARSTVDRLCRP
jgi:plasmid stability protein